MFSVSILVTGNRPASYSGEGVCLYELSHSTGEKPKVDDTTPDFTRV